MTVNVKDLEEKYDNEIAYRPLSHWLSTITGLIMFSLSAMQYYNAGLHAITDEWLLSITLATAMFLTFIFFGVNGKRTSTGFLTIGQVPIIDWLFALAGVISSLYIAFEFHELTFRVGNPLLADVVMGTILVVVVLEGTRRVMGATLPIVVITFMLYALFGQYFGGVLKHPGTNWTGLINHLYLTTQGIFGVPLHVTVAFVFHFVLFGAVAMRMGLGKLFLDLAYAIAGRFSGGPAKVSVISSAFFGMISGSSIANTVSTGVMTIPAMKKIGYRPEFAAAVEATASTGGQITPPLMGAAAFVMAEMLEVPYTDILIAATIPAFMHFWGVLIMVHLEAKRLGLKGLPASEIPKFLPTLLNNIIVLIPLVLLIGVLVNGMTASAASFYATSAALGIGFLSKRLPLKEIYEAFKDGSKYTLNIITAGAAVGIIIGVVTLSGMGFRISFIVVNFASEIGAFISGVVPFDLVSAPSATLFMGLVLTAIASIILGAGIPTTACYIILASIAAPTLGALGVPIIVSHFFVFYYGVLADITPPVAVAAYAGAGIANANPFKTGNIAFKLANAKALVPFIFVYTPSMLIITDNFNIYALIYAVLAALTSVALLGITFVGYIFNPIPMWQRVITGISALCIVGQTQNSVLFAILILSPVAFIQIKSYIASK